MPDQIHNYQFLICPNSKQTLTPMNVKELKFLNDKIAAGQLFTKRGEKINEPLDGALLTKNGTAVYPIRGGIAVMLSEESIIIEAGAFRPD